MWVCGGIQPDHSNIGRFILRHQEEIEGDFFASIVRLALEATGSSSAQVAADGTVLQAAGSRYRTLKGEALQAKLAHATQEVAGSPEDVEKQRRQKKYEAAATALEQRQQAREGERKASDTLRVCTTEPEAPVQKMKNGSFAPAYHASVLSNRQRVIVATDVQSSNEIKSVAPMLDEAQTI
jgi:hypothetical protein